MCNILLITNDEWHKLDPTLGWNRDMVPGGLEIRRIPGNHITYITENIHLVAAVMKDSLEKAMHRSEKSLVSGTHDS
jgi:hypothetical protein